LGVDYWVLEQADKTSLASESWRQFARSEADQILREVNRHIVEIRARLEKTDDSRTGI
jgi:hypothetical protein